MSVFFAPTAADDLELGLYFGAGPRPPKRLTSQAQRYRRARVEAALDGGGHALQRYYAGELSAHDPGLAREYADWARRFHARGRPSKLTAHTVLTDSEVERLLTRDVRPQAETLQGSDGSWYQRHPDDEDQFTDKLGRVADLEARNLIEPSTWGDWRVSPEGARELLRASHWLDGEAVQLWTRRLDDDAALGAVRARLALLPEPHVEEEPEEQETFNPREAREVRAMLREEAREGGYLPLDPGARWVVRSDRDAGWTTITELADQHGVRRDWVRAELVRRRCPNVGAKRARLPSAWFATPGGREFWIDLLAESHRARDERRAAKSRLTTQTAELVLRRRSLNRLDSYQPVGRIENP